MGTGPDITDVSTPATLGQPRRLLNECEHIYVTRAKGYRRDDITERHLLRLWRWQDGLHLKRHVAIWGK